MVQRCRGGARRGRRQPSARGGSDIDTDVSIVVPAYNEQDRLPATLDRLERELPEVLPGAWEIVVSDDGSTDGTRGIVEARSADPRIRLVSNNVNRGKGAALLAGALAATHRWVLFLDADLPVPVATIPRMIDFGAEADLVVGSRRLPGATFDPPQPLFRRLGGAGFRAAVALLGYEITSDPQCGVKLLRNDRLAPVLAQLECTGFAFDVELIVRARRNGCAVTELPVAWSHVEGSSLRPIRDAMTTLLELTQLRGRMERTAVAVP
jgi:dolichyl-phosphate beta-glucosyltransferase